MVRHTDKADTNMEPESSRDLVTLFSCHPEYIPILLLNHNSDVCQLQMAGIAG